MKISSIKRIIVEDYGAEQRTLVQRLAQTLNGFLEQVTNALSGQLTLRENSKGKLYSVDLPIGVSTQTVAWALNEKPASVTIGQLVVAGGTAPTAAFSLSWAYTSTPAAGLVLTFIGLDASTHHTATIVAQV